ncbi:uncharacterized protein J8A68_003579 [[Candida] subhashii]|uniref:AB hydrolase-1 domain-containing protein n=1 Tax=[Candida] subhashii TaxID=561895 RepID=A0A8J5QLX8_9ASCO|nr:uncharacterized protein J8A68_003579 [[Candida] subhashii]KAG7662895.1 hypothetical protein J8A68_003579 [[Candida] subhashii]
MISRLGLIRTPVVSSKRFLSVATQSSTPNTSNSPIDLHPSFHLDDIPDLPFEERVILPYKQYKPYSNHIDQTLTPILMVHGLFGNKSNYNVVGREISRITKHPVYGVDLRNHGDAPHVLPHTYSQLASDLHDFIMDRHWKSVILVGHSMGAKASMILSLLYPELIEKLVVVDNTPHYKPLSKQYEWDLLGMCEVEEKHPDVKDAEGKRVVDVKKVERMLSKYEPDPVVRQFLMQNLLTKPGHHKFSMAKNPHKEVFKTPVMNFYKHGIVPSLGGWPNIGSADKYLKPVLVLSGKKSEFVLPEYYYEFDRYFDDVEYEEFDCGHWISSEKPKEFVEAISKFVTESS